MSTFMMESATINETNWNDVLSSPALASPPPSASEHRRQSTASTHQSWEDGIFGASSNTMSPDHLHEVFTPSIDPPQDQASFRLLNTKLSLAHQAQYHGTFAALTNNGLLSPCSPHDEPCRFDYSIDHESQPQWDHTTRVFASFRPAPIITPSHNLMFSTQTDTPPNTASSSFDSGIEMITPLSRSYMTSGQQARDVMSLDASMDFYDSLPTAPVVPSQTVFGSACMPVPALYRSDSVKPETSSPALDHLTALFPHDRRPSRVMKRKSGKGSKRKAFNTNIVSKNLQTGRYILHDKQGPVVLDYENNKYTNPVKKEKPGKYCSHESNGKRCNAHFYRTEHLTRHRVMHTGIRGHSCPVPFHTQKKDKAPIKGPNEKKFSRHDNSYDHISKHVSAWLKGLPEYKTKGSPRTDPMSPEEMQDIVIVWKGLNAATGTLHQLWKRVKRDVPGVDTFKHCFTLIKEEVLELERTGRGT